MHTPHAHQACLPSRPHWRSAEFEEFEEQRRGFLLLYVTLFVWFYSTRKWKWEYLYCSRIPTPPWMQPCEATSWPLFRQNTISVLRSIASSLLYQPRSLLTVMAPRIILKPGPKPKDNGSRQRDGSTGRATKSPSPQKRASPLATGAENSSNGGATGRKRSSTPSASPPAGGSAKKSSSSPKTSPRTSPSGSAVAGTSNGKVVQKQAPRMQRKWTGRHSTLRSRGLRNDGNMCYRNAVLQCLMHLRAYSLYFEHVHLNCEVPKAVCVPRSLKDLLDTYWSDQAEKQAEQALTDTMEAAYNTMDNNIHPDHPLSTFFAKSLQADAPEFLTYFLDELVASEPTDAALKIEELFNIRHEQEWVCDECGQISLTKDLPGEAGHGWGITANILEPERMIGSIMSYFRANAYEQKLEMYCESE
ncbi:uncharacterized protein LTR77_002642 [Saxophila tyrrhenica]|uniref:USP domain-containing protein n=1 Tax=Saxophila tyrrhenica TaxID=1690608 RepID=A0AAV9PIQ3_9PEZI|nr:hypothetical protein LTR77_002642 [Saxophila tyrrhenica]